MKLANGMGSVYKLSGRRRKPWVARKTKGWDIDEKTGKTKQLYMTIGYFPTRPGSSYCSLLITMKIHMI